MKCTWTWSRQTYSLIARLTWTMPGCWQHSINPAKSSTMKLGKNKSDIIYSINGIQVPVVQSVQDLGLSYDSNLKFDDYIHKITTRAYQRIGLIFRGFISGNRDLLKRAFIVYVRPIILEYCTCVWSPYLLKDIHKVENVQRYFTRRLSLIVRIVTKRGCNF